MDFKNKIITANQADGTISVIDKFNTKNSDNLNVGLESGPNEILFNNRYLFVLQSFKNQLLCIDITTEQQKTVPVGCRPNSMCFSNDETKIYVVNSDSNNVSVIELESLSLIGQFSAGILPEAVAQHPSEPLLAVTNIYSNDIVIIDCIKYDIISRIRIDDFPSRIVFDNHNNYFYATCWYEDGCNHGRVIKIDIDSLNIVKEVSTGTMPCRLRLINNYIYVVSAGYDEVEIIDTVNMKIVEHYPCGRMPYDIDFDKDKAYVSNCRDSTISVIDTSNASIIEVINVGKEPKGIIVT